MNLTKKTEKEVMEVYDSYWENYLNGNINAMASLIDDNFNMIGSTAGEVFYNKKEVIQYYNITTDQITGKVELRNRNIMPKTVDGVIHIIEVCDLYIMIENKWRFYSKIRISSQLIKRNGSWMFVQQHGSIPDSKALEGEQVAFDKISRENLELRDAVKRRTAELEQSNRELEIETALEKVRSSALAMKQSSDMVEVCRIISDQLQLLGVNNIRNVQTAIINEEKGTYLNYQYFTAYGRGIVEETDYNKHPTILELAQEITKSADAFFSGSFEGKDLNEFREYRRQDNQSLDPLLDEATTLNYNFYSIGLGGLGLTTYKQLPQAGLEIFKRFHNVFTLAYRRFLDIEKAEEQAREAKIEAALERVRAKAMAMNSPEDLAITVDVFFRALKTLISAPRRCGVGFVDEETRIADITATSATEQGEDLKIAGKLKLAGHPVLESVYENWKLQKEFHPVLKGNEIKEYYQIMNPQVEFPDFQEDEIQYGYYFYFKEGGVFAWTDNELAESDLQIFRRYTSVLSLTYRRYKELKNAEAQNYIIEAENERKTKELEEARQLQISMLPKTLPDLPNLEIAVSMKTATEVGGDYYDFYIGEDGTLTAALGDATGHGLKAGTMVTITKSQFNSLADKEDIVKTFTKISGVIKNMNFKHLTMCLILLKIKDDKLFITSAAMPPALIYRKKNDIVEELFVKGMPLGAMNNFPYSLEKSHLEKGDTILLFSDGLPEMTNHNNEMYGYDRIKTEFHLVGNKKSEKIIEHLNNSASSWLSGKELEDDVTFVVIKAK